MPNSAARASSTEVVTADNVSCTTVWLEGKKNLLLALQFLQQIRFQISAAGYFHDLEERQQDDVVLLLIGHRQKMPCTLEQRFEPKHRPNAFRQWILVGDHGRACFARGLGGFSPNRGGAAYPRVGLGASGGLRQCQEFFVKLCNPGGDVRYCPGVFDDVRGMSQSGRLVSPGRK